YSQEGNVIEASSKKEADKRYVGNGIPDYVFSWNNTFKYKRFDLSLFFKGALKWDVYNLHQMYYGLINAPGNVLKDAYGKNAHIKAEKEASSYFLEKGRSEEHTSELQSRENLVCRLLLEKKKENNNKTQINQ